MRGIKTLLAAALVLAVILTTNAVWSQAEDDPVVYYACVNNRTGRLRMVTASSQCRKNETEIFWNQTGPAGPPGVSLDRYVDLVDGTVLDRHTGLVWLKDADCAFLSPNNWADATMKASQLESGMCGLTDGSWQGDWRLPTKTEWMTTVAEAKAMGCVEPVLTDVTGLDCYSSGEQWAENINIYGCGYWTSTPHFSEPDVAPYVHLANGGFGPGAKDNPCFNAWPVRSGPEGKIE